LISRIFGRPKGLGLNSKMNERNWGQHQKRKTTE